jgi:hypothetical protein
MYLIAHHPGSAKKPVMSFYSQRLRQDGGEGLKEAHKKMFQMILGLKMSQIHTAAALGSKLKETEDLCQEKDREIERLRAETEQRDATIRSLQSQVVAGSS